MNVKKLIDMLSKFNPDAEVLIAGEVDGNFWEPTPEETEDSVIL